MQHIVNIQRTVLCDISTTLPDAVDPHQFSFYRSKGSVDIAMALLSIRQHLDNYTHAGLLFLIYSSIINTIRAMILTVKLADPGCLQKLRWSKKPQDSWPSSNRQPALGQKHRYSSEQRLNVMR